MSLDKLLFNNGKNIRISFPDVEQVLLLGGYEVGRYGVMLTGYVRELSNGRFHAKLAGDFKNRVNTIELHFDDLVNGFHKVNKNTEKLKKEVKRLKQINRDILGCEEIKPTPKQNLDEWVYEDRLEMLKISQNEIKKEIERVSEENARNLDERIRNRRWYIRLRQVIHSYLFM